MSQHFFDLKEVTEHEPLPGFRVRFVHSGTMTFAYWTIRAGSKLPEHKHMHEQVAHMMTGTFELTIDGETKVLEPGTVAVIPGDVLHSGTAITDCTIIDAFNPIREDYVEKFK